MEIEIIGGTKKIRRAVEKCADWCGKELLGTRLFDKIFIEISLKYLDEKHLGFCVWSDDNNNPREFVIELERRLDFETMLKTLCHEMIHVKQYAKSEMREIYRGGHQVRWKGRYYGIDNSKEPWEIEAYGKQQKLYDRMLAANPDLGFNWPYDYGVRKNKLKEHIV